MSNRYFPFFFSLFFSLCEALLFYHHFYDRPIFIRKPSATSFLRKSHRTHLNVRDVFKLKKKIWFLLPLSQLYFRIAVGGLWGELKEKFTYFSPLSSFPLFSISVKLIAAFIIYIYFLFLLYLAFYQNLKNKFDVWINTPQRLVHFSQLLAFPSEFQCEQPSALSFSYL